MALLDLESFDGVAVGDIFGGHSRWSYSLASASSTRAIVSGRTNNGLSFKSSGASIWPNLLYFPKNPKTTVIMGFAIKWSGNQTTGMWAMSFSGDRTGNVSRIAGFYEYVDGWAYNIAYESSNPVGTIPTPAKDIWTYIEFKIVSHSSAGIINVKYNNVDQINLTGINNFGNEISHFDIQVDDNDQKSFIIDDFYICDDSGSQNNDFLGPISVDTLYPNGNGTTNQWTGSDADSTDNYLHVDETTPDGDTSYVGESTINNKDLYAYDSLNGANIQSIKGIAVYSYAKVSDVGTRGWKHVCRSSATESDSTELFTGASAYQLEHSIYETDPNTASAWTESGVNAAEFGLKVTS